MPCLITRELEKRMVGVKLESLASKEIEQRVSVLLIDDSDLAAEGENAKERMQEILDLHEMLYAAAEGEIEISKMKHCTWQ